ncbi:EamA family transporter [Actinomadura rupiterrae]|uniref:EamA family transporter n=1 Tax=Actinomadura rupiterrae TaxID=559627 RepID=UPI0020A602AD|nr:EamA family transporter [Actinomadura rupiterrae]MCP2343856.1 drug/metabolite transporter (DMT)-like permease [Actinomadura rupiterrae]
MGEALALAAAVCFGTTHFLSGLLSRRVDATAVALVAQLGGTLLIAVAAPWFAAPHVTPGDLAWGVLSGVGTGVGVVFLYRALGEGKFSVVVPLSDVAAVALPVLVGVSLLSERPGWAAWCGIAASVPALWLVARPASPQPDASPSSARAAGTRDALVAGIGFALQFVALARVGHDSGLWPLVAARAMSVVAILPMASAMWRAPDEPARQRHLAAETVPNPPKADATLGPARTDEAATRNAGARVGRVRMGPAMVAGAMGTGTLAITLYTLATREQLMTLAVVLTSLYPVIPVVLGLAVLRERLGRAQLAGLGCAAAAIVLISLG